MLKIVLAVSAAAALISTAPLVTPAQAEGVKMAQGVDVQIGRDRDDRYDRERRYDRETTVGVGPGGVTIGPRERCRSSLGGSRLPPRDRPVCPNLARCAQRQSSRPSWRAGTPR